MSPLGLFPDAEPLLDMLVKKFRKDRDRWPLWTYERRSPGFGLKVDRSWYGVPWIDRLRWSTLFPVARVVAAVAALVERKGGWLTNFQIKSCSFTWLKPAASKVKGEPRHAVHINHGELAIEPSLRLVMAFAAATHPSPPENASELDLPRDWSIVRLPLDDKDIADLQGSYRRAIAGVSRGSATSRFLRFLEFESKRAMGDFASQRAMETEREKLTRELAAASHLLVESRRGGQRVTLGKRLAQLRDEAEDIISAVRSWEAGGELLSAVRQAVSQSSNQTDRLLQKRIAERLARRLRYPLLTESELHGALSKDGRGVPELARSWIHDRLAADVTLRTLQNLIRKSSDSMS